MLIEKQLGIDRENFHAGRIDIDVIATGDCWQGQECVAINLIDQVGVSDDYVLSLTQKYDVMHINLIDNKPKFSIISWIAKYFKIIK